MNNEKIGNPSNWPINRESISVLETYVVNAYEEVVVIIPFCSDTI